MRKVSFEEACGRYPHRYTMEHVPAWAKRPANNGKYYAPQYATDQEWYDLTIFPGEKHLNARSRYCESTKESWPLGHWLDNPYKKG
jgi:hypothetical protein